MRLLCLFLACLSLSACAVSGGKTTFGVVSTMRPATFHSLEKRVSGEACSSPLSTDDYRKAALQAISKVPGANALSDATMESRETLFGGFCLRVSGTAGVLK
jgi:nicotinamidase-related amidase